MIRFYADAHIAHAVAKQLGLRDIDMETAVDAGLKDAPDEQHLAYAYERQRVFVTRDQDFLRLHAAGHPHAGIVFFHKAVSIGDQVNALSLICGVETSESIRGRVEYL